MSVFIIFLYVLPCLKASPIYKNISTKLGIKYFPIKIILHFINKATKSLFSLTLQSTYSIDNRCLLHNWLKKTKIISKASYIVNSERNISIDLPFGQHWTFGKGGGDIYKDRDSISPRPPYPLKRLFKFKKKNK